MFTPAISRANFLEDISSIVAPFLHSLKNIQANLTLWSGSQLAQVTGDSRPPILTFTANPIIVTSGRQSALLSWSSINATSCTSSGDGASWGWSGARATKGTQYTPTLTIAGYTPGATIVQTYVYTMSCTGQGGKTTSSVTVTVVPPKALVPQGIQLTADRIWAEYEKTKGHIAYTQLKMLEKKYGVVPTALQPQKNPSSYNEYYRSQQYYYPQPEGYTILDTVYKIPTLGYSNGGSFTNELDFLTGKRAANETLQLGSIAPRRSVGNGAQDVDVSSITRLSVKSHPWDEMIGRLDKKAEVPKIFSLVPIDDFLVYFKEPRSFDALEASLKEMASLGDSFFDMKEAAGIKKEIATRLGISDIKRLESLAGEFAFVSEDLSFVPRTDYALIFATAKKDTSDIATLIESGKSSHGSVGEYYVIAGSDRLFQRIKGAYEGRARSMYKAKDVEYALSVLDDRRDGFIYFSEDFILKLVGPEYRINAGRRSEILPKMNTLQYSVLAYKGITGAWPSSLKQMAQEGYVDTVYIEGLTQEGFSVDTDGRVRHKDWGTLYDVHSVSNVSINKVTRAEADRYNSFREGYQSLWREFFDPIGIAITVGDHIYFHTIILPLIDESQYQMAKSFTGDTPIPFDGVRAPLRQSPILFLSHFNFDKFVTDVLYESLGVARRKGATAATQANIVNIRAQAELYYDSHKNSYGPATTSCGGGIFTDINITQGIKAAETASQGTAVCRAAPQAYALSIEIKEAGAHFCIDSTGRAAFTKSPITSTACGQALSTAERTRLEREARERASTKTSEAEVQKKINEYLWEELNLEKSGVKKEEFDLFGMIGNEVQFGIGKDLPFELKSIADYDVYVAIKLTDTERMKKFINTMYKSVASQFLRGNNFGFFSISSDEPLKNIYNGTEYYVIPTGFVNLYYLYHNNYFYATISQKGINNLIEGVTNKDKQGTLTSLQKRAIDYVGDSHNMMVAADLTSYNDYKKRLIDASIEQGYYLASQARSLRAYLADYYSAKSFLGGDSGKAQEYFTLPDTFRGLPLAVVDRGVLLGKEKYLFDEIDFGDSSRGYSYDYYGMSSTKTNTDTAKDKKKFSNLFSEEDKARMLADSDKFKGFSVGLSFTPEGLDAKVAIKNPLVDTPDKRFQGEGKSWGKLSGYIIYGAIGVGVLVIFGIGGWLVIRIRRKRMNAALLQGIISENGASLPIPLGVKEGIISIQQTETPLSSSVNSETENITGGGSIGETQPTSSARNISEDPLLVYIKSARATGISDVIITQELQKTGWSVADISRALNS